MRYYAAYSIKHNVLCSGQSSSKKNKWNLKYSIFKKIKSKFTSKEKKVLCPYTHTTYKLHNPIFSEKTVTSKNP